MNDLTITDDELALARQGAHSAWKSGRGLVSFDDLVGEANLWMVEHLDKVVAWREKGKHGANTLRRACRQRCLTIIDRERKVRSGLLPGDTFWYSVQMLRELLPDIFDIDDWTGQGSIPVSGEIKSPARPSEGNNRLAMICDVRAAFGKLTDEEQAFIAEVYQSNTPWEVLAERMGVHERTVRRREERLLERMVEALGGEAPFR